MRYALLIAACAVAIGYATTSVSLRDTSNSSSDLVNIANINPTIVLDLRYASEHNFTGKRLYDTAVCFLRREVAYRLDSAQRDLRTLGLGLKIFDGYRPLSVQRKMWELVPDERYVANPAKGSRHNRGAAVDVTLVDSLGKEMRMPTDYDDFTEKAHRNYTDQPYEILKNRAILDSIMDIYGFTGLETEWWHFDAEGWERYEIMDVDFHTLLHQR